MKTEMRFRPCGTPDGVRSQEINTYNDMNADFMLLTLFEQPAIKPTERYDVPIEAIRMDNDDKVLPHRFCVAVLKRREKNILSIRRQ